MININMIFELNSVPCCLKSSLRYYWFFVATLLFIMPLLFYSIYFYGNVCDIYPTIHAIKSKLNFLVEKLQSRNASIKSPLTKQCLQIIEAYVPYLFKRTYRIYSLNVFEIIIRSCWLLCLFYSFIQIK